MKEHDEFNKANPGADTEQKKQLEARFREQEKRNTFRAFFDIYSQKDSGFEIYTDRNIPEDYLDAFKKPKTGVAAFFQLDSDNNLLVSKINNVAGIKSDEIKTLRVFESANILLKKAADFLRVEINGENIRIPIQSSGSSSSAYDRNKIIRFENNNGLLISPSGEDSSRSEIIRLVNFVSNQNTENQDLAGERIRQEQERQRQEQIIVQQNTQENQANIDRQSQINQRKQQLLGSDLGRIMRKNSDLDRNLDANKKYTVVIFGEYCYYCTGFQGSLETMLKRELESQGLSDYVDIRLAETKYFAESGYNRYSLVQSMQSTLDNSGNRAEPDDMHQLLFRDGQMIYYNRGYGADRSWYGSSNTKPNSGPPPVRDNENRAKMIVNAIRSNF